MTNLVARMRNSAIQITKWQKDNDIFSGYIDYMSNINLAESQLEYVDMFGLTSRQMEDYLFKLSDAIDDKDCNKAKAMVDELYKRVFYDFKKDIDLWDKEFR